MAKKGVVQLQIDVETEEEWEALVEREGLILVDVYSEWCGPCAGMSGALRKLKLEIGGDIFTLATAKSDNIQCLERFRNKSEPTWMFISNGNMIRLMFGANAPRLISISTDEIARQKRAIIDKTPREGIRFDQLTDEEQERVDEETRIMEEASRIEREAKERATNERRLEIVQNLEEPLKEFNFVMVWPHVSNEGITQIFDAVKETGLSVGGKPTKMTLTDEQVYEMLYFCTWDLSKEAIEELEKGDITGLLFQAPMVEFEEDVITIMLQKLYGNMMMPPGDEESLGKKLSITIEKEKETPAEEEEIALVLEEPRGRLNSLPRNKTTESAHAHEEQVGELTPEIETVEIPGVFVPENEHMKIVSMRILFPIVTQKYDLPEPEPIPPHLIVAFDAFKKNEVLQLASDYPLETMQIGFFTSAECELAKLIAKTSEQYDKIFAPPFEAKLVLQVSKKQSEPLLSYSILGPCYVSPNTVIGEKECSIFFPEGYDIPEPVMEEEPVKRKSRRRRRVRKVTDSKTSVTEELEDEEDESSEEEEEEEIEEEEEAEEEEVSLDDDDLLADLMKDYEPPQEPSIPESSETNKATTTEDFTDTISQATTISIATEVTESSAENEQ